MRTVKIAMRPRDRREKLLPYKTKTLEEMEVGVKRLCLIHPAEDPLKLASPDTHDDDIDDEDVNENND